MPHETIELPTLSAEGLILRPGSRTEIERVAHAIAVDPEASPWWSPDAEVVARWLGDETYSVLMIEQGGTVIGILGFSEVQEPEYRSAGIDITLLSGSVGHGIGTRALKTLVRWLVDERGHHRITIDPAVANTRAIRAYEKVGFRPVGVMREYERGADGTWHDNLLMDLLARELSD